MTLEAAFIIVLLAFSALYLAMIVAVTVGILRLEGQQAFSGTDSIKVSVIIPARNEEKNIHELLEGLSKQDYPAGLCEFILADDQSEDRTVEVARQFSETHPSFFFRIISAEGTETLYSKKKLLEKAIDMASGELIITTDADVIHSPGWVKTIVDFYKKEKPAMILGPVAYMEERGWIEEFQSLELVALMGITAGSCRLGIPLMCNGANLAFKRTAFLDCGGFEGNREFASGDDMFLLMKFVKRYGRKKVKFLLSQDATVHTRPQPTLADFFRQRFRWVSKSRGYTDLRILSAAFITYVFNLALLFGLVAGIRVPSVLWISLTVIVVRILLEGPLVWIMARFLGKDKLMAWFPLADILYAPYVVITGLLGMVVPFQWKGRKVNRGGFAKEGPLQPPGPPAG